MHSPTANQSMALDASHRTIVEPVQRRSIQPEPTLKWYIGDKDSERGHPLLDDNLGNT